jgi:hypothetical protein
MTVAFDTETHLIEPGLLAPPLVCAQWTVDGDAPSLVHRANTYERVLEWLESDHVLVGHNIAYDMGVIAAQYPWLMPLILRAYNQDRVTDTQIREQLIMIARGEFRSYADADGDLHPVKYSLADCVRRHFSTELKKDGWRLFYRAFDQTPNTLDWHEVATRFQDACRRGEWPDWASAVTDKDRQGLLAARPEEAVLYALEDARVTHRLYESQRTPLLARHVHRRVPSGPGGVRPASLFVLGHLHGQGRGRPVRGYAARRARDAAIGPDGRGTDP